MDIKKLEKTLWAAANKLRGSLDASAYKDVVLGLIFLKYISDRFETEYEKNLQDENNKKYANDKDLYTQDNIFWVPKNSRWSYIKTKAKDEDIKQILDKAFLEIEKENKQLKGILPKTYTGLAVESIKLGQLIDLFSNELDTFTAEGDLIGQVYEYFLGEFARASGTKGGEFYTPRSIVKLLVELIEPTKGRVYDPCCGSAGMFVQANKFIESHGGSTIDISVYGQELNATTWRLAKMNLAIRGITVDLGKRQADTFSDDQHKDIKVDYILANPPFNLKDYGIEKLQEDPRWIYGIPPKNNSNYAWIQHMISKLKQNGVAAIVLANGSLSTSGKSEFAIRKAMLEAGIVECIISLPDKLFYTTQIPVSVWIFRRGRKDKNTLFINVDDTFGEMETKKVRIFKDEDINLIKKQYADFRNNELNEKIGFAKIASLEEIKEADYSLVPGMYVGYEDDLEFQGIDIDEEIKKTSSELLKLFDDKNDLEKAVKEALKKLEKL